MDDDSASRPGAGGPGDELPDSGAPTPEPARSWWRRRWVLVVVIVVIVGAGALYLLDGRYGARGWCDATARVRRNMGDAATGRDSAEEIYIAQVAVAAEEAPALVARADRMVWPRGDLADRAANALVDVAAAENPGDQQLPLEQFLDLDNEFRDKHCDSQGRT